MPRPSGGGSARATGTIGVALALALALALGGCRDGGREAGEDAAAAHAEADAHAQAKAHADADAAAAADSGTGTGTGTGTGGERACRIMTSEGGPRLGADPSTWLEVAERGTFAVKDLVTGRELRFEGPGRVRPCGFDVPLVAEGAAVGLPGSGEGAGSEQWVATACGVARWSGGVHRFEARKGECKIQSSTGNALVFLAEDVTAHEVVVDAGAPDSGAPALDAGAPRLDAGAPERWRSLEAKHALRLQPKTSITTPAATALALGACERAARAVEELATRMTAAVAAGSREAGTLDGSPGSPAPGLGDLAAESVIARRTARASCAVAAARIALAGGREEDVRRLDAAASRWRGPAPRGARAE